MNRLTGKVALITGANSGIGKRTAEVFASEGADLVLVARRADKLKEVEEECIAAGVKAISVSADVTSYDDCRRAVAAAIDTFGRIDVLVNNAGIADKNRSIDHCEPEFWDEVIQIDQTSVYYMMKSALEHMVEAGKGSIVNVSSIGGTAYNSGFAYSTAKAAVIAMSHNAAMQYAGTGIRINTVAPGPTPTPMNTPDKVKDFDMEFCFHCDKFFNHTLPDATVDDQANAILFFAADESKACTGQVIVVDNGMTL